MITRPGAAQFPGGAGEVEQSAHGHGTGDGAQQTDDQPLDAQG